ncbi:MlaD family protein [Caulobacter sp. 17J80-11]|uniref:MlaD family protein n=1 Tax=Caulobacter sp. 17J80-11 TaxID=2763502 RepID=UPI001653842A|nr:MlaD family protein [Caulobacter sp. 17J80-11]MBC6983463.1 MCE family protein [Caulobacter sp. 17J80-11]
MERNAHYAAVGLATLVLLVGMALFAVWLARFQFARDYDVYDVLFHGPVRGLSEGGEVHFNGIKVGEVTDLNLDPRNPDRVIARVRMTSDVPVKTDSRAQLEPQGITGVNYIQITAGTPEAKLLKALYPENVVPVIQSQPSPISELLTGGGDVLARAIDALNRVNRVLSDENIAAFSSTMAHAQSISAELDERKAVLAKAEAAIEKAGVAADEFAALAKSGRSLTDGEGKRALANIESAAAEINAAAKDIRAVTAKLEGPTTEFATTGLPQMTAAATSLQEAADTLNRLASEAQASPQTLISKAPAKEKEVPR